MGGIRRYGMVLGVLVALMMLAGSAEAQMKYKLRLPTVVSYELNLPSLVAYANNYFAEEGIDMEGFILGSGGTTRTLLITKEVDFILLAFVHVPLARLKGSPFKAVISTHDMEIFSMVVRRELKDQVKTMADLKGRKVGFTRPGAGSWAFATLFLKKAGLNPDADVQMIPIGGDPAVILTALQSGKIDAYSAWEPTTTRVIEEGIAYPLVRIWEPADHKKWIGKRALSMAVVTREDVIKDKPDLVERMVNVHKKGLAFIRSHDAAQIADVVSNNPKTAELFKGLSRPLVEKILGRIHGGFGTGCLSRSGFETEMKLHVEYKIIDRAITFEEFGDPTWAGVCP